MASWVWPFLAGNDERHRHAVVVVDDVFADLTDGAFAHTENVVDAACLQIGDGGRRDHAAIGDDAGPLDAEPLLKAPHHRHQRGDVGGIAGHQERRDRPIVAIEHDAEHHLVEVRPVVLRMASLAQAGAASALEPQAGGVEEGDRDLAEQRLAVSVQGLFDGIRHHPALADVFAEPGHRLVGVAQGQTVGAGHLEATAPSAGMAIRARHHQAVHHRQIDGALDVEPELTVRQQSAQDIAAAQVLPQAAEQQVGADAEPLQRRQFAAVEARQHDRTAGMAGRRRDQRIQQPRWGCPAPC